MLRKRKTWIIDRGRIYLEDGTEIDEDQTMLACENGSVFGFWPGGEKWQMLSSCTSSSWEHSGVKGDGMANSKGKVGAGVCTTHFCPREPGTSLTFTCIKSECPA